MDANSVSMNFQGVSMPCRLLLLIGSITCLVATSATRAAEEPLYKIDEKIEGKIYSEWGVKFCQWACSIPKAKSPALDTTGKFAAEGQNAEVFFLAGNLGGVTRRSITVPEGKPIFSPIVFTIHFQQGAKDNSGDHVARAKRAMDLAAGLDVLLDGKPLDISKHRAAAKPFILDLPKDSIWGLEGKIEPALDGYWFALKPLPVGEHVIKVRGRIKGEAGKDDFELNITYTITVEKK